MTTHNEHEFQWHSRLQDWLDGALAADEQVAVDAHLETCHACREQLRTLRTLDTALQEAAPQLSLGAGFDARVFAQIDAENHAQRAFERARVQAEIEAQLAQLARDWRRTLGVLIPGVLAGIALAFGFAAYFETADWVRELTAHSTGEIGVANATFLHALLTSGVGAGIGYAVANWLSG